MAGRRQVKRHRRGLETLDPKPLNPLILDPKPLNPLILDPKPLNPSRNPDGWRLRVWGLGFGVEGLRLGCEGPGTC
jgi:hypothetical protein